MQFVEVADQSPAGHVIAVGDAELDPVAAQLMEVIRNGEREIEFAGAVAGAVPIDE